jgi:hypothetical protein
MKRRAITMDEAIDEAQACDERAAILAKLRQGASRDGTTFTRVECETLLQVLPQALSPRPRRRGRKGDPELRERDETVAMLAALYRSDGMSKADVVAKIRTLFGVSRSQVYAARRQYPSDAGREMDATYRRGLINMLEVGWSK